MYYTDEEIEQESEIMNTPNEIYLVPDDDRDKDLLNTLNALLNRGYDVLITNEEGAYVLRYDNNESLGLGNNTFEYISPEEKEMVYNSRYNEDENYNNQNEVFSDLEYRLLLNAISREEEACKREEEKFSNADTAVNLMELMKSIERKIRKIQNGG